MGPTRRKLDDSRWFFQHGPIDLVINADAADLAEGAGHNGSSLLDEVIDDCWRQFAEVLPNLVAELPTLRRPMTLNAPRVDGPVARRMVAACQPYNEHFITPMAAVAGSVADHLLSAFKRPGIRRAYLNNGGDIALHLAPGESYSIGLFADLARVADLLAEGRHALDGVLTVHAAMPVRGVATSGWRGRSFSLGIADSVTVTARDAASADAAATMIANAVNVEDRRIVRRPACEMKDDSDLGSLRVTVDVPELSPELVAMALQRGCQEASRWRAAGLIDAAILVCQRQVRVVESACVARGLAQPIHVLMVPPSIPEMLVSEALVSEAPVSEVPVSEVPVSLAPFSQQPIPRRAAP